MYLFLLVTWPSAAVSAVSEALRQSNAQFCSADVLGRLSVKLRSSERGDIGVGWDVFLLDYAIDSPLHATRQNWIHRENCTSEIQKEFFMEIQLPLHLFVSIYIMQYVNVYNHVYIMLIYRYVLYITCCMCVV